MTIQDYIQSLQLTHNQVSLEQLAEFQTKHLDLYSFSSINAMSEEILSLDVEALLTRLIENKQGGYCFEHNKLAYLALAELGYEVQPLLARVLVNGLEDNPRTHRITLVHLGEESYLVDVGFGSKSLSAPLPVSKSGYVDVESYRYKIIRSADTIRVEIVHPEEVSLYSADLSRVTEKDFEVVHYYSHQHPDSYFANNLVLARITNGKRYTLRNLLYGELHEASQISTHIDVTSASQLQSILQQKFLLHIDMAKAEHLYTLAQDKMVG
ncbi:MULTISPECIES: arylamine N-acetyltransferase [unclassified Pseudoalteromonas]|uniref:arylamine N-acetyltransferase family protein n=1 Tax=unclassified Pseudoalteromonas TaxID=194690 RepID=UPI0020981D95|nr:arylamine N-acetyltransferase [Pseudoalteromonas sp. XMcav2-N]MCO7190922.1 arylamine N-acetyltransferase [Pseudoalteromonas sp. XMcav2-N]